LLTGAAVILYFCPAITTKSAGIRTLYRHVQILQKHGLPAAILHASSGFEMPDMPPVPTRFLDAPGTPAPGDVVVIPEPFINLMQNLRTFPVRRMVMALNWKFVYEILPDGLDWRTFGIERILTKSRFIGDYLTWAMGLSSHVFTWGIKREYYYFDPAQKRNEIVFLLRKQQTMLELKRTLFSRDPRFLKEITWYGLDNLPEAEYASHIRRASMFINLSHAEGFPGAMLEAMAAGTLVAGYHSVGGQRELIGAGDHQNCLLAPCLDYPALARLIEPFLQDMLAGQMSRWDPIIRSGLSTACAYSLEAEEASVVSLWRELLQ
jgi:hypothetical protein